MKRYALVFLIISAALFGSNAAARAEFDDGTVIAVVKSVNTGIRVVSAEPDFSALGITEIESAPMPGQRGISLFDASGARRVLKLTIAEPGEENVLETVGALNAMPEVEYAEPNYIYRLSDIPDDTNYPSQYGLDLISAPVVWDMNISCSDVTVAVVDTGIDENHPDLAENIWTNPGEIPDNGVDDDNNGFTDDVHGWDFTENDNVPDDVHGHGTHVAGIISAVTNNGEGVASLARDAKIVPLKVFDASGTTTGYDAFRAISYAAVMGFKVVNNSFGSGKNDDPAESVIMLEAINQCTDSVFVAAAGNEKSDNDSFPVYPADFDCPNIISVASVDSGDKLSSFSNYGANSVDIAAPGTSILSTVPGGKYGNKSGTSMACPMVASAAAVVRAAYPKLTPEEVIEKLISSADAVEALDGKVRGSARLNAAAALEGYTPYEDDGYAFKISGLSCGNGRVRMSIRSSTGEKGTVLAAAYSRDGVLTGLALKEIEIPAGGSTDAELELSTEGAATVSAFIWNGVSDMRPEAAGDSVDLTEQ